MVAKAGRGHHRIAFKAVQRLVDKGRGDFIDGIDVASIGEYCSHSSGLFQSSKNMFEHA